MQSTILTQSNSRSMRKFNIFQLLMTVISIVALLLFFSLADADDIKERWFMLLALLLVIFGIFSSQFKKKAAWTRTDISLSENKLLLKGTGKTIPFTSLNLDIYSESDGTFSRYHLWDKNKTLAIFSVKEDDLLRQLSGQERKFNITVRNFTETDADYNRSTYEIKVFTDDSHSLFYNIDTGHYSLKSPEQDEPMSALPEYYVYDPVYVAG